jgi:hypothetical protein
MRFLVDTPTAEAKRTPGVRAIGQQSRPKVLLGRHVMSPHGGGPVAFDDGLSGPAAILWLARHGRSHQRLPKPRLLTSHRSATLDYEEVYPVRQVVSRDA